MPHLVLLGDSIFDNAAYVPGQPAVIDQVREALGTKWQATLLAIDGDVVSGVSGQLRRLPADATHLAISVGGNDALRESGILYQPVQRVDAVLAQFADIQDAFRDRYRAMLQAAAITGLPLIACTIYDSIPGLAREARLALSIFNDVILREAVTSRVPVLDLRLVCDQARDYSAISPIEPSAAGGEKIARALAAILTTHDFSRRECVVFS